MAREQITRRLAAILAADVAGYSQMMSEDEVTTLSAMREIWSETFNPTVTRHHGRVVKMMGDGALVEFQSVVDAVECAVAFQLAMVARNQEAEPPVQFRVGINLGDIVLQDDDILGDGVNVAARLEEAAPAGGILTSDAVYRQVAGKTAATFVDVGEIKLKNIARPLRVWRWQLENSGAARTSAADFRLPLPIDKPSIAVLPFSVMGNDEQEFFADGLVEDILATLSKLSGLAVIARNSSFTYKGRAVDVRQVARELGVRFVLEGSVRKVGNRMRIVTQLIDATSGVHIWAERFDRNVEDIFALQDEITLTLATEMQVKLTEGEQARLRYSTTTNVEAWNYWVQGLSHFREGTHTRDGTGRARDYWEKALALDPDSAPLRAMLAFVHWLSALKGWWDDRDTELSKADALVDSALAINSTNAEAYWVLSHIHSLSGRHDEAVTAIRQALEYAPGAADIAAFASWVLSWAGLYGDAVVQIQKAMRLNPNFLAFYFGLLGNAYRLAGRIDDAIAAFVALSERMPDEGHLDLAILYQNVGRYDEARDEVARHLISYPGATVHGWAAIQIRRDRAGVEAELAALRSLGLPE